MKKTIYFAVFAGLLSFTGCLSHRLTAHNREYNEAGKSATTQNHFATTREALLAIWGKSQTYYCDSSDSKFHYLTLYYDTWFKRRYSYKLPSATKFARAERVATQDSLRQRFKIGFQ